jgi:hypothetical protein
MANSDSTNGDFAGLTTAQVKAILSTIATQANTLSEICLSHAEQHDNAELGTVFRSLDMMLCSIGALADKPLGGQCVGSDADWHCGPNFSNT